MADSSGIGDAASGGRRIARTAAAPLPVCRVPLPRDSGEMARSLVDHEWLVTNGIGGYSSGTVSGVVTRRYHGLLVAALRNPLGRMVLLNTIGESFDKIVHTLVGQQPPNEKNTLAS